MARRLPKGGFLIQLSYEANAKLASQRRSLGTIRINLPDYGVWEFKPRSNPLSGHPSVVIAGIGPELSEQFIETELKDHNRIPQLNFNIELMGVQRLQRRNPITTALEPSRSVRIYLSDSSVTQRLLEHETVSIGGLLALIRPYNPPRRYCLNCKSFGSHTAQDCRRPTTTQNSTPDSRQQNSPPAALATATGDTIMMDTENGVHLAP